MKVPLALLMHWAENPEALEKFDPNQPRDQGGKWTSGGGVKLSTAAKVHPRILRRRLRRLQEIHDRVVGRLQKEHGAAVAKYDALHTKWHAAKTAEQKNKIRDQMVKAQAKFEAREKEIATRQAKLTEHARKVVEVPEHSRSQNKFEAAHEDVASRPGVHAGIALYDRYATKDIDVGHPIQIDIAKSDRAYYSMETKAVYVDSEDKADEFAHEMGHLVEDAHPAIMRESINFLTRRTAGENTEKLNDIFTAKLGAKCESFQDNEIAKVDKFHDPYVGKQYIGLDGRHAATEVLSMGIQRLDRDPIEFQKNDPDYFDHVINCLRGRYK